MHEIRVDQIMIKEVISLSAKTTYLELQQYLAIRPRIHALPLVDSPGFLEIPLFLFLKRDFDESDYL